MAFASPSVINAKGATSTSLSYRGSASRIRVPHVPPRPTYRHRYARMVSVPETLSNANSVSTTPPATTDVVVIGAGPAGLSLSAALGERDVSVVCVDPALDKAWPNNYGTWEDELVPLGLQDCVSNTWRKTAVYMENEGAKTVLHRTYVRVDRKKLKKRLLEKCEASGNVQVIHAKATEVDTKSCENISTVKFDTQQAFNSRIVIDATGHSLRFTKLMESHDSDKPGYQAAYGIECEIKGELKDFSGDEMVLMDFRDNHMQQDSSNKGISEKEPTFLYVMPLGGNRVFFEETSLVANPAMDFDVLKERLYKRLDYHGIEISRVEDEEFCLIPMGGSLPDASQRIVAYGGAAAFVHPATGYMIARALTLAQSTATGIVSALDSGNDSCAGDISRAVWASTWNASMLSQRDFLNYGGSYLQKIGLSETRDFFAAFFKLPIEQWGGFLSFKLEQPIERLIFGLGVFFHTTNRVRSHLVFDSLTNGGAPFFLSLLPLSWTQPTMPTSIKNEE